MEYSYFTTADYLVLASCLTISVSTGIFFAFKDRNEKSTISYFFGNNAMPPIPVGLSLAVSFISALTIIGFPTEIYLHGTVFIWIVFSLPICTWIASSYFVPVYYNLKLKSVYEYLELRFNKPARLLCSALAMVDLTVYMSVAIYTPATAMTALTSISIYTTIGVSCAVCTFYTVIGGFKSVIWADTFQSFIMFMGSVIILVRTTTLVGGVSNIIEALERGNRTTFWTFDTDPTKIASMWPILIGYIMTWIVVMAINQAEVQRYLSCKSIRDSRIALIACVIPQMVILLIATANGCAAYAYFEGCDPVKNNETESYDHIMPLIVAKITKGLNGLNGLFVATVYCATLSTVSSGINAISVIVMEDFAPLVFKFKRRKLLASKICGLIIGLVIFFLAYGVSFVQGSVVTICITLLSCCAPAVFGMYIMGIFIPWTNSKGALFGSACGFASGVWLSIGSILWASGKSQVLDVSIDQCFHNFTFFNTPNLTQSVTNSTTTLDIEENLTIYDISYMYIQWVTFLTTLLVGILISFITGANDPSVMDPKLFMPLISSKVFPKRLLKLMRCGVPTQNNKDDIIYGIESEKLTVNS